VEKHSSSLSVEVLAVPHWKQFLCNMQIERMSARIVFCWHCKSVLGLASLDWFIWAETSCFLVSVCRKLFCSSSRCQVIWKIELINCFVKCWHLSLSGGWLDLLNWLPTICKFENRSTFNGSLEFCHTNFFMCCTSVDFDCYVDKSLTSNVLN